MVKTLQYTDQFNFLNYNNFIVHVHCLNSFSCWLQYCCVAYNKGNIVLFLSNYVTNVRVKIKQQLKRLVLKE